MQTLKHERARCLRALIPYSLPFIACMPKITAETVRDDFNDLIAVIHYTRAAHELGLWKSERTLIERFFLHRDAPLIEAGCGAGRGSGRGVHMPMVTAERDPTRRRGQAWTPGRCLGSDAPNPPHVRRV